MKVYRGVNTEKGNVVSEEDAFAYALDRVGNDPSLREEFVQWFFSGDFIEEDDENEYN